MKKLGFGCMRLPLLDKNNQTSFNLKEANEMADYFIDNGFTYFDTAYVYHEGQSETAVKEFLVKRHKRDSFTLADKMLASCMQTKVDRDKMFDDQLKKCGVDYFDYYLFHSLNYDFYKKLMELDCYEFCLKKKKEGKIKHFGISFHDEPKLLEKILTELKEVEFVQLQINYLDWLDSSIQAKACYEIARKFDKPIIVMEPVKGGNLAVLPKSAEKLMKDFDKNASIASWAIRYAAGLDGIMTVLSGMSNLKQLKNNVEFMKDFKPLSSKEQEILLQVTKIIQDEKKIGCTACRYCVDGCPKKIAIPEVFSLYNSAKSHDENFSSQLMYYTNLNSKYGKVVECLSCEACTMHCPQHLKIPELLKEVDKFFEKGKFPSHVQRAD